MAEYPTRELSLLETHLIPEMSRQELIDRLLEYEAEIERLKSLTPQPEIPNRDGKKYQWNKNFNK